MNFKGKGDSDSFVFTACLCRPQVAKKTKQKNPLAV